MYQLKKHLPILIIAFVIIGFASAKYAGFNRFYHEAFILALIVFYVSLYRTGLIFIFFLIMHATLLSLLSPESFSDFLFKNLSTTLTIAPLALLICRPKKILSSENALNALLGIYFVVFLVVLWNVTFWVYEEPGGRFSGPFKNSLHLSYFLIFGNIVAHHLRPKIFIRLALASGFIFMAWATGSRIAFAGVLAVNAWHLLKISGPYVRIFTAVLTSYIVFAFAGKTRVLSIIPAAEYERFMGWVRWGEVIQLDVFQAIIGSGRWTYGAVGARFIGNESFITESSFIMLLYSYGMIFGGVLVFVFVYGISRSNIDLPEKFLLIVFFALSPFIDSPSVFVANMLMLFILNKLVRTSDLKVLMSTRCQV